MSIITTILTVLVALLFFYIMYLGPLLQIQMLRVEYLI